MNWLNDPNGEVTPNDTCSFYLCWTRDDGGGACGVNWCITRYCLSQY